MNIEVRGWLVEKDGELEEVLLCRTNDPDVYITASIPSLFGLSSNKFYVLNKTFFIDRLLALRKAKESARFEINRITQQIEAYNIEIKRIESERLLGESELCSLE